VYLLSEFLDEFGQGGKGIKPEEGERKKTVRLEPVSALG
jgi:hypothetical protein